MALLGGSGITPAVAVQQSGCFIVAGGSKQVPAEVAADSLSPWRRWRARDIAPGFRRDWTNAAGRHVPMSVKAATAVLTPSPLVFSLTLPDVAVAFGEVVLTPSPLAFPLVLPDVDAGIAVDVLTPDPLVFPLTLPDVAVAFGEVILTPDPLVFPFVLPSVAINMPQFLTPDPLVFTFALPSLAVEFGPVFLTPDPLVFRLFLPRLRRGVGEATAGRVITKVLYDVLLTGSADSTTDLQLSAQSVQISLRSTGNDVLSIYVPGAASVLSSVLARLNGDLVVWERTVYSDGSETIAEVHRGLMTEAVRRDRGPKRDTLTLGSRVAAQAFAGTHRALAHVLQALLLSGSSSFRVPYDSDIRPGDIVSYGGNSFTVGAMQINLSPTARTMELQESE